MPQTFCLTAIILLPMVQGSFGPFGLESEEKVSKGVPGPLGTNGPKSQKGRPFQLSKMALIAMAPLTALSVGARSAPLSNGQNILSFLCLIFGIILSFSLVRNACFAESTRENLLFVVFLAISKNQQ